MWVDSSMQASRVPTMLSFDPKKTQPGHVMPGGQALLLPGFGETQGMIVHGAPRAVVVALPGRAFVLSTLAAQLLLQVVG